MPMDFSGEGYPRGLAALMVPAGWEVLSTRFFDVLEFEREQNPEFKGQVLSLEYDKGFLRFELTDYTPALEQLCKEVLVASLSTCIVCCCNGRVRSLVGYSDGTSIPREEVLCDACTRSAIEFGRKPAPGEFLPSEAAGEWSPHPRTDRPWDPNRDRDDDEADGLTGDEPGNAPV